MRIADVMSRELLTVTPETALAEAATVMSQGRTGSVLILEGGRLAGIFTERDVVRAVSHSPDATSDPVEGWMSRGPITIDSGASVGHALDVMLEHGFRHLPVFEEGELVGVVSMRDISRALAKKPAFA